VSSKSESSEKPNPLDSVLLDSAGADRASSAHVRNVRLTVRNNDINPKTADRIMRTPEMETVSGLSRWTIWRAAKRGELKLIKLTAKARGCRESEFWRWIDSKAA